MVCEWFAFFMAAGVSAVLIANSSQRLRAMIARPELISAFAEFGMKAVASTPAAPASRIAAEQRDWEPIIRASDVRAE